MIVSMVNLDEDEKSFQGEEPGSILELDDNEFIRVDSPVRYDLKVNLVNREVVVRGEIAADISFVCMRCTEFFEVTVRDSSFLRVIEVNDKTECVDLTGDIRETIILAFAVSPICDSGCKGLCDQCGINRNKEKCECVPPAIDDCWGTLNELRLS
jgi:uncharacterized protein